MDSDVFLVSMCCILSLLLGVHMGTFVGMFMAENELDKEMLCDCKNVDYCDLRSSLILNKTIEECAINLRYESLLCDYKIEVVKAYYEGQK